VCGWRLAQAEEAAAEVDPAEDFRDQVAPETLSGPGCRCRFGTGHEALHGSHRGNRHQVRDGADPRRQVHDGQPGIGGRPQRRRGSATRGHRRAVLDGQIRDRLGRLRNVVLRNWTSVGREQMREQRPIGTSSRTPSPGPPRPIRTCLSAWARRIGPPCA